MSLINKLLQDLDKRRSRQKEDVELPEGTEATPVQKNRKVLSPAVWLVPAVVFALAAAAYLWLPQTRSGTIDRNLQAAAPIKIQPSEESVEMAKVSQSEVQAALMTTVFQLSGGLASGVAEPNPGGRVDSSTMNGVKQNSASTKAKTRNGAATKHLAATTIGEKESTSKSVSKKRNKDAKDALKQDASTVSKPRIAKAARRSSGIEPNALQEVAIPAGASTGPIARKTRQLTPYELAEAEFRKGVAHLRRGQMIDAEAQFRMAMKEDRSHVASRQALVGILIEAGRNEDAEQVLSESLHINARQPTEAMILARLQVERGDSEAAIRTLERVSPYAGSDAGYYSFLAAVYQRASRHEEAVIQYSNALALMPRSAVWLMGIGISLRALREYERAQEAFKSAADTGTLSPELQAYVVQQYTQLRLLAAR